MPTASAAIAASPANAPLGGARPRSRARGTRASAFTAASSGSPTCSATRLRCARVAHVRDDDAEAAPREPEPREQQRRAPARRARREHRRSRRSRRSSRARAPERSRRRRASRSRRSRAIRSRRRGRALRAMPCSSIRSACSGSAGAGSTRQAPCASPAPSSAGVVTGPHAIRISASGITTSAPATSAASPIARARSSTKARSSADGRAQRRTSSCPCRRRRPGSATCPSSSAVRAASDAVEAAGCSQRVPQGVGIEWPLEHSHRPALERLPRRSSVTRLRRPAALAHRSGAIVHRERDRLPRRARSRPPAGCRRRRSAPGRAMRCRAGRRVPHAARRRPPRHRPGVRCGRSRPVAAQEQPQVAPCAAARASATATGARTVTMIPRSARSPERAARARARQRAIHVRRRPPHRRDGPGAASAHREPRQVPVPMRAHARRRAAAKTRRCGAAHRARGNPRRRGRSTSADPRACPTRPPSKACGRRRRSARRRRRVRGRPPPAAIACRSTSTTVRGSSLAGSNPRTRASIASARPVAASQCSRIRSSPASRFTTRPPRPAFAADAA